MRQSTRRGNVITTVLVLPVLMSIGTLSVDLSQAFVARAQLQNVVDLGARSGVNLLDGTSEGMVEAVEAAIRVTGSNDVLGADIRVDGVATGYWTDGAFVASTDAELVNAMQIGAAADVDMFFASLVLGVESIPVSTEAVAANDAGGAGAVDCFLPLAIPDCVLDDTSTATLQDFEFTLSPAGKDNVGWARPADQGNPSASWVRSHLLDCESAGTMMVGDELWLNNGTQTTSMRALSDLIDNMGESWDASVYGELPEQMSNSSVSNYGNVIEGAILVFEGDADYCAGNGKWNDKDAVLVGMAWGAVYDVSTQGSAASKNIKVRLDLEREHRVGTDLGGTDYGVTAGSPALVR